MAKTSPIGAILSGIVLAGLPLLAIARHRHIETQDVRFVVPATVMPRSDVENLDIWSEINSLDLSELSGTNMVQRGDVVYIHMAAGPDKIAYPFAITPYRPDSDGTTFFSIRGKVTDRQDDTIIVRYNFETFLPPQALKTVVRQRSDYKASVEVAVNQKAIGRLLAVEVDGVRYPYRMIENPLLKGFTQ